LSTSFSIDAQVEECDDRLYVARPYELGLAGFSSVTEREVQEYRQTGFLVIRGAFSHDRADDARRELEAMAVAEDPECAAVDLESTTWQHLEERGFPKPPGREPKLSEAQHDEMQARFLSLDPPVRASLVRKFVGFTKQHPPLGSLARDPALLGVLGMLVGDKVRLYQSQALVKPSGGREKPWHQDHAYFNFPLDTRIVVVWIALDQATPENGCMFVVPRGHTSPLIHFQRRDWQICDTDMEGRQAVSLPMAAGDVLLFDGKLPHGTPPNRTSQQRWAVQYHYVPARAEMVEPAVRLAAFGSEGKNVKC
jgi:phytanoyl-CoA hydroxylase